VIIHDEPAAAIVPVEVGKAGARYLRMTETQAEAFLDEIAAAAPKSAMSIQDALGRSRLETD
jgi:hypothetical protein